LIGEEYFDFLFEKLDHSSTDLCAYTVQENSAVIADIRNIIQEFSSGLEKGQYTFKFDFEIP